jgi:hypothetical protein
MQFARMPFNTRTSKALRAGSRFTPWRGDAQASNFSSSSSPEPVEDEVKISPETADQRDRGPVLVYKAMFAAKLKLLRRISLTSSISSVIGLVNLIPLSK